MGDNNKVGDSEPNHIVQDETGNSVDVRSHTHVQWAEGEQQYRVSVETEYVDIETAREQFAPVAVTLAVRDGNVCVIETLDDAYSAHAVAEMLSAFANHNPNKAAL